MGKNKRSMLTRQRNLKKSKMLKIRVKRLTKNNHKSKRNNKMPLIKPFNRNRLLKKKI
jgi:hypothetical protein